MDENKENEVNNVESEVNQSTNTTATNDKKGFSIAALVLGIITGVIGMILSIVLVVSIVLLGVSIFNSTKDAIDNSNYPSSYYYYND